MNIKQIRQEIIHIIYKHYEQIPTCQKIHIKKELLEELLFITCDGYIYNSNQYVSFKVPVWTGPTLSKIDLSEISFDHVLWNYQILELISAQPSHPLKPFQVKYEIYDLSTKNENIYEIVERNHNHLAIHPHLDHSIEASFPIIDLSDTNALIDFKTAFTVKDLDCHTLYNCYFDGTNLSTAHLEYCTKVHNATFHGTNIQSHNINKNGHFTNCSFENCDLSKLTIDYNQFKTLFGYTCNLKNTGLHIKNVPPKKDSILMSIIFNHFENCYLNGVKITQEPNKTIEKKFQTYQKQFQLLQQKKYKKF